MAGNDTTFEFSPKVRDFVAKAMQNKTAVAMLRPDLLPDPKRTEPFTKYDLSEFYQLRIACVRGVADRAAAVYDIKKEEVGKVCDAVLVAAADQMRKGVPVDDPTHLLAPYLVSQQNRGYTSADGSPLAIAITGARAAAVINVSSERADDNVLMYDMRKALKPESWPKSIPASQPLLLASLKGGAKDAAFAAAAGYALATKGDYLLESGTGRATLPEVIDDSYSCNASNTPSTRKKCAGIGYTMGNHYISKGAALLK